MQKLEIAGILFHIRTRYRLTCTLKPFVSKSDHTPDVTVRFRKDRSIPVPDCREVLSDRIKWYSDDLNNDRYICINNSISGEVLSKMKTDRGWEHALITYDGRKLDSIMMAGPLGGILFRNRLLLSNGIMLHAAAIQWQGKGIVFSAPSGVGKSTQAGLWKKYMGADVINGDRSAVKIVDKQAYVYGSPWCGSSAEYLNQQAPLKAIILLEQAKDNLLLPLDKRTALEGLLPRCFLPYYDDGGEAMDMALKTLDDILSEVPVYLLKCKPEREAVELVYQCVK
jgi:hypothetical protein